MAQYYFTPAGKIINESNVVIPQEQGNPLYTAYIAFLTTGGTVSASTYMSATDITATAVTAQLIVEERRALDGQQATLTFNATLAVTPVITPFSSTTTDIAVALLPIKTEMNNGQWTNAEALLLAEGSSRIGVPMYNTLLNTITTYIATHY